MGINTSANLGIGGRSMQEFLLLNTQANQSTYENTITEKKTSFGGGFFVSPIIGYQINKYIGFEIQGTSYKTKTISTTVNYTNPSDNKFDISMNGKISSIRPSLIGYVHKDKPLIYVKAGAVYSICEFTINTNYQKLNKQTTILINGGKSLGVSFGAGADFSLSKRFYVRTELNYVNSNYFPEKAEFTKFNVNGADLLLTMTTKQKAINYVKNGDIEDTYLGAALDPGTHLSPQIPISNFGINLSLIYKFNKRNNN